MGGMRSLASRHFQSQAPLLFAAGPGEGRTSVSGRCLRLESPAWEYCCVLLQGLCKASPFSVVFIAFVGITGGFSTPARPQHVTRRLDVGCVRFSTGLRRCPHLQARHPRPHSGGATQIIILRPLEDLEVRG